MIQMYNIRVQNEAEWPQGLLLEHEMILTIDNCNCRLEIYSITQQGSTGYIKILNSEAYKK